MGLLVAALAGLPGAGKTTLAKELQRRLDLSVVDRDAIRHALFEYCGYTRDENRAAERAVRNAIEENSQRGISSLVDGMTFARRTVRQRFARHAQQCGARFVVLWIDCPHEVARQRVNGDHKEGLHPAADRMPQLVDRIAAGFEAPTSALRIDATLPAGEVLARAHKLLATTLENVA